MSQKTPVRLDPGENQPIVIRRARRANLVFKFWNDRAFTDPHNIEDDFKFSLYKDSRDKRNPLIDESSIDGDLVIDGNEIRFPFDEDNSDIDLRTAYYELQNITTVQNWMQGEVEILTGEAPNKTGTEVNKSINLGDTVVNVEVTLGGGTDISSLTPEQLQELWLALNQATSFDYTLDFNIQ